jgi:hypothetical protein
MGSVSRLKTKSRPSTTVLPALIFTLFEVIKLLNFRENRKAYMKTEVNLYRLFMVSTHGHSIISDYHAIVTHDTGCTAEHTEQHLWCTQEPYLL